MLRRSATKGLMVEASQKIHATVEVLFLRDVGVHHADEALMKLKTAPWRTRASNSRSELMMVPPRLVNLTSCQTMSSGHFIRQSKLVPSSFGLIQTPPVTFPEASA